MAATPLRLSPLSGLGLGGRFQLRHAPTKRVPSPAQPPAPGATPSTIDIEATYNLTFRATIPRRHPPTRPRLAAATQLRLSRPRPPLPAAGATPLVGARAGPGVGPKEAGLPVAARGPSPTSVSEQSQAASKRG